MERRKRNKLLLALLIIFFISIVPTKAYSKEYKIITKYHEVLAKWHIAKLTLTPLFSEGKMSGFKILIEFEI